MKRQISFLLGLGVLSVAIGGCASSKVAVDAGPVPENLRAPGTLLMTREVHATGVQIYQCRTTKDDVSRLEWSLVAPEAALYDRAGRKVGKHFAGPTWEATDGSAVVGEVVARATPDPKSIPWLLLNAKSTSGHGLFDAVKVIQRIHTSGGIAPADGCDAEHAGREKRVAYSADYRFYVESR